MSALEPSYLELLSNGEFGGRIELARQALSACVLCGWRCGVNRATDLGPCRTGVEVKVATSYLHFGEEQPLVGHNGSGAIFFTNCDLRCQFCQTARWNIKGQGHLIAIEDLANLMLWLQDQGAANINLVTPTHVASQIIEAVFLAARKGLRLPLVWNSGGYDTIETLSLVEDIVDIYLPDMKYSDPELGRRMSGVRDYPRVNQEAVLEMHHQTGDLQLDQDGVATRGIIVRHLVMPGHLDNTKDILTWIAQNLGVHTYLSLMDQYRPAYRAFARSDISRPISTEEYARARHMALSAGLSRLDKGLVLTQPEAGLRDAL